ncbi:hypothetical protein Tco_1193100 [Tanacetum coccineum]
MPSSTTEEVPTEKNIIVYVVWSSVAHESCLHGSRAPEHPLELMLCGTSKSTVYVYSANQSMSFYAVKYYNNRVLRMIAPNRCIMLKSDIYTERALYELIRIRVVLSGMIVRSVSEIVNYVSRVLECRKHVPRLSVGENIRYSVSEHRYRSNTV